MKLSPEAILLRWVNYQLEKSGTNRRCANFNSDITDSEVYTYLLKQIAPLDAGVTMEALRVNVVTAYYYLFYSPNLVFEIFSSIYNLQPIRKTICYVALK